MCGICGILGRKTEYNLAEKMLASIAHRGPDDEGLFLEGEIFLGHRRLSILDLSAAGHQPMIYGEYVIVFNGEIYNYLELRAELKELGHNFTTGTDTEVILHAFAEWRYDCFSKMRGMWALCIYDRKCNEVVLSRDRFGIKPLYYLYKDNEELIFASEISSLWVCDIPRRPNIDRVVAYLMIEINEDRETTFFEDIYQLSGGNILIYDTNSKKIKKKFYYDLAGSVSPCTAEEYKKEYLNVVKQHLRSDVKIGTCLSGGLDSSTLAAVSNSLRGAKTSPLIAVTAKSEDSENDESDYAEKVVKHCGLGWSIAFPTYQDFVDHHKDMLHAQEEPVGSPSVFMQFWVMKQAKSEGLKVMLDGQGGDETLLGYERYYASYLLMCLKKLKPWSLLREYRRIVNSSKLTPVSVIQYFIYFSCFWIRKMLLKRRMHFIKKEYSNRFFEKYKTLLIQNDDIVKLQVDEITKGHLSSLLHYEDRNSMYFSIESRVPYVDHVLVEKALGLGVVEKVSKGYTKYVLRSIAEKYLPNEVAWRKNKYGFEAPEKKWLDKFVDEMQKTIYSSEILKEVLTEIPNLHKVSLRERWRLYNLAVWEKQFFSINV